MRVDILQLSNYNFIIARAELQWNFLRDANFADDPNLLANLGFPRFYFRGSLECITTIDNTYP